MIFNLFEATRKYWHQLDELESAYQQGKISLERVDTRVAELMAELARERRIAWNYFWHSWQNWLNANKENVIGFAVLAFVIYTWMLTCSIS
jgi:hypothetical protein